MHTVHAYVRPIRMQLLSGRLTLIVNSTVGQFEEKIISMCSL